MTNGLNPSSSHVKAKCHWFAFRVRQDSEGEKLRRESRHGLWRMSRALADAVAWALFPKALLQNLPKPPKDPESKADRPSAKSRVTTLYASTQAVVAFPFLKKRTHCAHTVTIPKPQNPKHQSPMP